KGRGGLYLLLPPDYEGAVPSGYHTFRSRTYSVFLFWRAMLTRGPDGPDTKAGVEAIERTQIYPLRENAPDRWKKMQFPEVRPLRLDQLRAAVMVRRQPRPGDGKRAESLKAASRARSGPDDEATTGSPRGYRFKSNLQGNQTLRSVPVPERWVVRI